MTTLIETNYNYEIEETYSLEDVIKLESYYRLEGLLRILTSGVASFVGWSLTDNELVAVGAGVAMYLNIKLAYWTRDRADREAIRYYHKLSNFESL